MSRRRRALLLGGLALVLGGLAASNVAGREAALARRVGGLVDVVVAREPISAGSAAVSYTHLTLPTNREV